jgi:D-alanyl-D-alanine carboxypeptidase
MTPQTLMRLLLALPGILPVIALAQAPSYGRERTRIDSLVSAEVRNAPIAGVAVAVVRGRDTIVMRGWGFADVENDVPVTPASVFRIGSITKQFTSAAIMQLVEKGRLSLEDTLGAMLPDVPPAWRKVTLRQLLNHTSGIPSYTDLGPRWFRRMREEMSPDSLLAFTTTDSMNFAPGSSWRYDNTGYVLLGMILDKATGSKYPNYLDDQLFKPLGLGSTMYCVTESIIKHRAQGYGRRGRQLTNADFLAMSQPYSAGALCSTVGDLVRWTQALHGGAVVSASSLTLMTTPVGAAILRHYGFGLGVDSLAGHRRIAHGGGINGFLTHAAYYPDDSLVIVVLANTSPAPVDLMARNVARIVFGLSPEPAPPARAAP